MKKQKKAAVLMALISVCLVSGCGSMGKKQKLSDEEVVNLVLAAYQQGDYESMMPYISEESRLHQLFAAVEAENPTDMEEVYQKAYELTKGFTYTAEAVKGKEKWGEVKIHIQTNDIVGGVSDSMEAAIAEQVEHGGDSFQNIPGWLQKGLGSGEPIDEEITVTVVSRDRRTYISTGENELLEALTGGFDSYMDLSMTVCTDEGETYEIAAENDWIIAMVEDSVFEVQPEELTEEYLGALTDTFASLEGVYIHAEAKGDDHLQLRLGFNMKTANSKDLADLGVISDRLTTGGGHLSLDSTISGFENSGMICETNHFRTEEKPAQ